MALEQLLNSRPKRIVLLTVVFALTPLLLRGNIYLERTFSLMLSFVLLAIALNIVFGHTNQLYLFTGALAGITGYATVIIAVDYGVPVWGALVIGIVLSTLLGSSVSFVGARLEFDIIVISIFTFSIQLAFIQYVIGARDLTGGSTGRPAPETALGGTEITYIMVGLLLGYLLLYDRLINSSYGLAFEALRTDDLAAKSVGVEVVKYKVIAGGLSSAMIGTVGGFVTLYEGWVTPTLFTFLAVDLLALTMLVFGGLRTLEGPVVGGVIIFWIDEMLAGIRGVRLIVFGFIILFLFLYFRQGLIPYLQDAIPDLRARFDKRSESHSSDRG